MPFRFLLYSLSAQTRNQLHFANYMLASVCSSFYTGKSRFRKVADACGPDFAGSVPIPLLALVATAVRVINLDSMILDR